MKKKIFIVTVLVTLILTLDQFVKIYIKTSFDFGDSSQNLIGSWFVLEYVENQGMAFGTKFGTQAWHKLALSLFRVVAISALVFYWFKQLKKGVKLEFLIVIGFIFSGALGNLLDSMFYDFIFQYNPCMPFNHLPGSGINSDCGFYGVIETRHNGFLFGNVVDMFKFHAYWPHWFPYLGGKEVFPAVWNVADASITLGVIMIFIRQKKYFPNSKKGILTVSYKEKLVNYLKRKPKA